MVKSAIKGIKRSIRHELFYAKLMWRLYLTSYSNGFRRRVSVVVHTAMAFVIVVSMLLPFINIKIARAATEGPNTANASGDCVNDNSIGTAAWTNPGNAAADDGTEAYASAYLATVNSNYLKCTNFGFSIPSTATIDGIQLTIDKRDYNGSNVVTDNAVRLVKGGTIGSTDRASGSNWPGTFTKVNHGGASDLWGDTWAPSDINASNFGAAVSSTITAGFTTEYSDVDVMEITVYYTDITYTTEQSSYRWFANNNSTDVGSPLASQDTAATAGVEPFRLRLTIHVGTDQMNASAGSFKLQYAEKSGTCDTSFTGETYADVGSATAISYYNNSTPSDGASLTTNANDPVHSGHTTVAQTYEEANNFSNSSAIPSGQDGLWDFSLTATNATPETDYCLRVVTSSDTLLNTYSVIPEITSPSLDFDQSGYRWFENQDITENSANPVAVSWGGSGSERSRGIAQDESGNIYITSDSATDQLLVKFNSSLIETWGKRLGAGVSGDSGTTNATAIDSTGNVYVVGESSDNDLSSETTNGDQTLVKYNSSGEEQWTKSWGASGTDEAYDIALDSSDNIYVVGSTNSTGRTAGSYDHTLVKYNSSGVEQWSKTWGGTGTDEALAVTLDDAGNIYVVGYSSSSGYSSETSNGDQTLVKYNSSGVEQWSKSWGGSGTDAAYDVVLDDSGNIFVAGFTDTASLASGLVDQTLVKYNSSGVEQWSKTWGGSGNDYANGLALDASDNIYVSGYTNTSGLTAGDYDQTLVKYNSSGVEQWSKTWGGTGADFANSVIIDPSGNIYVAGHYSSTNLSVGSYDISLMKFDGSGTTTNCSICVDRTTSETDHSMTEVNRTVSEVNRTVSEVNRTVSELDNVGQTLVHCGDVESVMYTLTGSGTDNIDAARGLTLDSSDNVYVAGYTNGFILGGDADGDLVASKFNSDFEEQWTTSVGYTGAESDDRAYDIAVDGSGNSYIVGSLSETSGDDLAVIAKFNSSGAEQWSKKIGDADSQESFNAVAIDGSDNLYAVGYSSGSLNTDLCSNTTINRAHSILVKFNSSGQEQWTKCYEMGDPGNTSAIARDVVLDDSGNIYVAGYVDADGTDADQVLVKFNSSGVEQWTKTWGGTGNDYARGLVLDGSGNIYMVGKSASSGLSSETTNGDLTLVKFNSSGQEQWSKSIGGTGEDYGFAVDIDASGNLYVAGYTNSSNLSNGSYDQLLVKFNSSGLEQWTKTWGGTGDDSFYDFKLGSNGKLYMIGSQNVTGSFTDYSLNITTTEATSCGGLCKLRDISEVNRTTSETNVTDSEINITVSETNISITLDSSRTVAEEAVNQSTLDNPGAQVGDPLAALNTAASLASRDTPVRLRILLDPALIAATNGASLKLQYSPKVGTCDSSFTGEVYNDVGTGTGFSYYNNTLLTDGYKVAPNANDPTDGNTVIYQAYEESASFTNPYAMAVSGESGLWDIALTADAEAFGGSWCFRVVQNSDGSALSVNTVIPELYIPPGNFQFMRHGTWFDAGGTKQPFYW